jgi:hypothetical protein
MFQDGYCTTNNIWKNKMHVPNHQPDAVFERSDL